MKQFTKNDLKPGMLVKVRDGSFFQVFEVKNGLCFANEDEYSALKFFTDDLHCSGILTPHEEWDVMEVWDLAEYPSKAFGLSTEGRYLLWEREEAEKDESNKNEELYELLKKLGLLGLSVEVFKTLEEVFEDDDDDEEESELEQMLRELYEELMDKMEEN